MTIFSSLTGGDLLNFAGGLMNRSADRRHRNQELELQRKSREMQKYQFDQQMDRSVQRRVLDAQKAGVHPLFALGANVGASPTATSPNRLPERGSAMGNALSGIGRRMAEAEIRARESEARKSEAEAALADSHTARLTNDMFSRGRDILGDGTFSTYQPEVPGEARYGVRAGPIPSDVDMRFPSGITRQVTDPNIGDEISQVEIAWHKLTDWMLNNPGNVWGRARAATVRELERLARNNRRRVVDRRRQQEEARKRSFNRKRNMWGFRELFDAMLRYR